jgi:hypothetical protein
VSDFQSKSLQPTVMLQLRTPIPGGPDKRAPFHGPFGFEKVLPDALGLLKVRSQVESPASLFGHFVVEGGERKEREREHVRKQTERA